MALKPHNSNQIITELLMINRTNIQQQKYCTLNNVFNNILNNIFNKVFNNISMTLDNLAIVGTFFLRFAVNNTVRIVPMPTITSIWIVRTRTRGGSK